MAQLVEYGKQFLIIGNKNAITYTEKVQNIAPYTDNLMKIELKQITVRELVQNYPFDLNRFAPLYFDR